MRRAFDRCVIRGRERREGPFLAACEQLQSVVRRLADDSAKSVAQAVKEAEGKIGAPVKIAGFVRYALGEGIEKQESDFAAEVAAASGKK